MAVFNALSETATQLQWVLVSSIIEKMKWSEMSIWFWWNSHIENILVKSVDKDRTSEIIMSESNTTFEGELQRIDRVPITSRAFSSEEVVLWQQIPPG